MKVSKRFLCPSVFALIVFLTCTAVVSPAATEKILHSFDPYPHGYNAQEFNPQYVMVRDSAGNLYGVTGGGGAYGNGTVFELQPNSRGGWTEKVIYNFRGGTDGFLPNPVIFDGAGNLYGTTYGGAIAFKLTPNASGEWTETTIYTFRSTADPIGSLVFDQAGNLYGVTLSGGTHGWGTAFELTPSTSGMWKKAVLHNFDDFVGDGVAPTNGLVVDNAGNLYGTTGGGGNGCSGGCGTAFELSRGPGGKWTENILHEFAGGSDGAFPNSGLIFDAAGNLYGVTFSGGGGTGTGCNYGCGTVFELIPGSNGQWTEEILYAFQGGSDGAEPSSNLSFDSAGNLYSSTYSGGGGSCGGYGCGTVFELSPSGPGQWTETVLWRFGSTGLPSSGVTIDPTGALYGETYADSFQPGINGTVFKLVQKNGQWQASTIADFPTVDARNPMAALVSDAEGNFYGASAGGTHDLAAVFELSPGSGGQWTEKVLYSFLTGQNSRADYDYGACSRLILDAAGNLYGERPSGGVYGYGTVFELSPSSSGGWTEKDLYTFSGGADGGYPTGGLVFDKGGNLYGTALGKGAGHGVIFELSPGPDGSWSETVIHTFGGYPSDGSEPGGGLIFDQAGNLYGTTYSGGSSVNCGFKDAGCGIVFQLSPASSGGWTETVLHAFSDSDGATPNPDLVFDASGNLYGTTQAGGNTCPNSLPPGCGTAFELSPATGGWTETVLYSFSNLGDGGYPLSGLIFDQSGNLYGTTSNPCEGTIYQLWCGNVYELSPSGGGTWSETVLHRFQPFGIDGSTPRGSLVMGLDGGLYGTTMRGGSANEGSMFEVIP
jgi:uncharacterized repeat protein (TIGR03803 family)